MRQIEIEEFTTHPALYVHDGDALEVQQDGRTIGYYLPVPSYSAEERQQAVEEWSKAVVQMRTAAGMTEDEFADLFDLTKPFPQELGSTEPATHAPGR